MLVYQNEWCPGTTNGVGGISLVDVTNPSQPKKLVEGAGDFTKRDGSQSSGVPQTKANQTHSAFAWEQRDRVGCQDRQGLRGARRRPRGARRRHPRHHEPEQAHDRLRDQPRPVRPDRPQPPARRRGLQPRHDRQAHRRARRDADVLLGRRLRDARRQQPGSAPSRCRTPTSRPPTRRATALGQTITPEGNAHEAEFTNDNKFFFATDEDFDPYRVQATFKGGPAAGTHVHGHPGRGHQAGQQGQPARSGDTRFLGLGCDPVRAAGGDLIAVVERGVCDFQVKLDNIAAAGYKGLIVFNRTGEDGCETLVSMLASSDTTPAIFVSRKDGFRLLGVEPRRRLHVRDRRRRRRHGHAGRPVGAGRRLGRVRRLGLHAHVQHRPHPRARR